MPRGCPKEVADTDSDRALAGCNSRLHTSLQCHAAWLSQRGRRHRLRPCTCRLQLSFAHFTPVSCRVVVPKRSQTQTPTVHLQVPTLVCTLHSSVVPRGCPKEVADTDSDRALAGCNSRLHMSLQCRAAWLSQRGRRHRLRPCTCRFQLSFAHVTPVSCRVVVPKRSQTQTPTVHLQVPTLVCTCHSSVVPRGCPKEVADTDSDRALAGCNSRLRMSLQCRAAWLSQRGHNHNHNTHNTQQHTTQNTTHNTNTTTTHNNTTQHKTQHNTTQHNTTQQHTTTHNNTQQHTTTHNNTTQPNNTPQHTTHHTQQTQPTATATMNMSSYRFSTFQPL